MGNSYYSKVAHPARPSSKHTHQSNDLAPAQENTVLAETLFHSMLTLERRRAERSCKAFVLMLLDGGLETKEADGILKLAVDVALVTKRETDLVGWYKENAILGIIFTEVNLLGDRPVSEILGLRVEKALVKNLGRDRAAKVAMSLHVFPESWNKNDPGWVAEREQQADSERKAFRGSAIAVSGK